MFRIVLPRPVGLGIYVRDDSGGIGVIGHPLRRSNFPLHALKKLKSKSIYYDPESGE